MEREGMRSGAPGSGAGGAPGAGADMLSTAELARLKQRLGVSEDMIAALGGAQGVSPQQLAAIRANQPVPLQPGQRAQLEPMLQGPAPNPRDGQFELQHGLDHHEVADGAWFGSDTPAPAPASTLQAPTASELTANGIVTAAIAASWTDSQVADATNRHEEGGWIYMDTTTGAITTRRAPRGGGASINLWNPPEVTGSVVVGNWHTHPNPTSEGWEPGPSGADLTNQGRRNVPGIVKADDGLHTFGANRRASLSGNPGFP
jgi:hypothetical protein